MKIRFTESRWLDTEDRTKVPRFRKGSTHDLSEASAYRWTRRGFAVYVVAEPVVEVKLDRPMMGGVPPEMDAPKSDFEAWAGKPAKKVKRRKPKDG